MNFTSKTTRIVIGGIALSLLVGGYVLNVISSMTGGDSNDSNDVSFKDAKFVDDGEVDGNSEHDRAWQKMLMLKNVAKIHDAVDSSYIDHGENVPIEPSLDNVDIAPTGKHALQILVGQNHSDNMAATVHQLSGDPEVDEPLRRGIVTDIDIEGIVLKEVDPDSHPPTD
jgi:hypothetical protein